MISLQRGQKITLTNSSAPMRIECEMEASPAHLNFSCFALDVGCKLTDERHLIFYNRKALPGNAIRLSSQGELQIFDLQLEKLPAVIHKLVFVASINESCGVRPLANCRLRVISGSDEIAHLAFAVQNFSCDKAVLVAEVYRRDGWRLAALAQGFNGGLETVLNHFGGIAASPIAIHPPTIEPSSGGDVCIRCGKKAGVWNRLRGFNTITKRCSECERETKAALEQLRRDFLAASSSGLLHDASWQAMWTRFDPARQKVSHAEALEYIRTDALHFIERLTTMAAADGIITPAEEKYIEQMLVCLSIPTEFQRPIKARLDHLKEIARIREGNLPRVTTSHHLDAGEVCHLEVAATFRKVNTRSVTNISGKLVATSKKLLFLSSTGGWSIQYKNIMRVEERPSTIYLELTTKTGNGNYTVADALWTEAVLTTLTRLAKRQLLGPRDGEMSRHIPQDVKNAVWQRDGGECVQCKAASYLEFDHIIPHSKGGANTVGNVQLLCRGCNAAKGNRI